MKSTDIIQTNGNGKHNPIAVIAGGFSLAVFIGATDFLTGPYLAFSIFYLIPVMLATWFAGRAAGFCLALFCAASWFIAEKLDPLQYPHFLIPYWNAFVRLGFFLVCSYLLALVKRALEKEKSISRTDALTGAENSRSFFETAEIEIEKMRRRGTPLSAVYIDVDNFKGVNDTLGHSAGDKLLSMVVHAVKQELRSIDTIARMGGDEFAILFPDTDHGGAEKATNRIKNKLDATMSANRWPVSFSVGVITFSKPPFSVNEMIKEADSLMYEVKNNGKNAIKTKVI
ncbi:MAG TPA: GGDEF domain-containing protein [bacterium]|nr:MAG: putative diguanylate cyclase YcdT [bacterium ADurb.Bin236]HOY62478.1 GGDEF domain-containing protein [bacterium]HPI76603.1 GGDEF domain-containing protein [bacterium]HPN95974.1 GGDEF domain-containing protein [bacterium]